MKRQYIILLIVAGLLSFFTACKNEATFKTLIVTGQSGHDWKVSSGALATILDQTGLFSCDITITPEKGADMSKFSPRFTKYKLVVLDYNGDSWPESTRKAFVDYVKNGGGVVIYHSSSLSFPDWKEYQEICGLGGNLNREDGVNIYYRRNRLVTDTTALSGGPSSKSKENEVRFRNLSHPITMGLPVRWIHAKDELYNRLCGPGKNLEIIATAFSDTAGNGTGRDEPVLMTITYEKGKIFHTTLGQPEEDGGPAIQCAGFIITLQRGAEWAVTGSVTQQVPFDFPNAGALSLRQDFKETTLEEDMANIINYDIGKSTKYFTDLQANIRKVAGDAPALLRYEKLMVEVLKNVNATIESKKLMLVELSWMGTDYSIPVIKDLTANAELKDEAEFALARLTQTN